MSRSWRSNIASSSSASCASWSTMCTSGRSTAKRVSRLGRIWVPTLCMSPTRSRPRFPVVTASMSASAMRNVASTVRACSRSTSPAAVRRTGFGPPGRSKTAVPAVRSSEAICWLTADCV